MWLFQLANALHCDFLFVCCWSKILLEQYNQRLLKMLFITASYERHFICLALLCDSFILFLFLLISCCVIPFVAIYYLEASLWPSSGIMLFVFFGVFIVLYLLKVFGLIPILKPHTPFYFRSLTYFNSNWIILDFNLFLIYFFSFENFAFVRNNISKDVLTFLLRYSAPNDVFCKK